MKSIALYLTTDRGGRVEKVVCRPNKFIPYYKRPRQLDEQPIATVHQHSRHSFGWSLCSGRTSGYNTIVHSGKESTQDAAIQAAYRAWCGRY